MASSVAPRLVTGGRGQEKAARPGGQVPCGEDRGLQVRAGPTPSPRLSSACGKWVLRRKIPHPPHKEMAEGLRSHPCARSLLETPQRKEIDTFLIGAGDRWGARARGREGSGSPAQQRGLSGAQAGTGPNCPASSSPELSRSLIQRGRNFGESLWGGLFKASVTELGPLGDVGGTPGDRQKAVGEGRRS